MVLEGTFYQLIERDANNVNKIWKVLHLSLFLGIIISGFITAMFFAHLIKAYGDNCILYANLSLSASRFLPESTTQLAQSMRPIVVYSDEDEEREEGKPSKTVASTSTTPGTTMGTAEKLARLKSDFTTLEFKDTIWSPDQLCMFCQFTPIMSMIFGIIWGVFYAACARGDVEYTNMSMRTHRMLYPLIVFSVMFLIILGCSTIYMSGGINAFCRELLVNFNEKWCSININQFTVAPHKETYNPHAYTIVSCFFAYVGLFCWIGQVVLAVLRVMCVTDFDLIVTSVTQKLPESLQPISEEDVTSLETELRML